jgi:ammonium transporter, Amt family
VARLVRLQRRIGRLAGLIEGNPHQLLIQLYGVAVTLVWSGGVTFVLLSW